MKKLILLFTLLLTSYVFADHNSKYDLGQYNFYFLDLPGVCGTPAEVEKYTTAHEFEPTEVSLGRTDSSPDGQPVYMITTIKVKDWQQLIYLKAVRDVWYFTHLTRQK